MSGLSGCGVGLRREHYQHVLDERPPVPWFEVISENFMVPGGRPRHVLERVRRDYPVALHGVSLSLGSTEGVDAEHLERLQATAAARGIPAPTRTRASGWATSTWTRRPACGSTVAA